MRTICTSTAAFALLLAAHGPLSAQEPPATGQSPQPPATSSEVESDDGPAWGDWQGNMMGEYPGWDWHEHMMAEHPGLWEDHWGPGRMMGWRDRGPGMGWSGGMPMLLGGRMMMAMIDADGNGSISLDEIEVVQRRIFNFFDEDKNGELSLEEIQAISGWRSSTPTP